MQMEPTSWSEIGLTDLIFAFRKAKADCFFESSVRVAEKFVRYEQNLAEALTALLQRLHNEEVRDVLSEGLGAPVIFPKKVGIDAPPAPNSVHSFFSDAKRAFQKEKITG